MEGSRGHSLSHLGATSGLWSQIWIHFRSFSGSTREAFADLTRSFREGAIELLSRIIVEPNE